MAVKYGFSYEIKDGKVVINGFYKASGGVDIPEIIQGHPVSEIGKGAFFRRAGLTRVLIPESVTDIGSSAFINCSGLTKIEIPGSVRKIEDSAFKNCTRLTEVIFDGQPPKIGREAFTGTRSILYYNPACSGWGCELGGRPTRPMISKR